MNSDSAILALLARLTAEGIAYQQRIAQLEAEIARLTPPRPEPGSDA